MSLPELAALFSRGRAEVRGRGATTAPAFAVAVLQRGVDAGVHEFRRFVLLRTTSENTFESRLAATVPVGAGADAALAEALDTALALRDSLPGDRKQGQRWIFHGLRGRLECALIELAAKPSPEAACAVVDGMVRALRKVDRNRGHRTHKPSVQFRLLPGAWAAALLDELGGSAHSEVRLALALATLLPGRKTGASDKRSAGPLLPYWLGVEGRGPWWRFPEAAPFRRVWGSGELASNLIAVLQRRLLEEEPQAEPPFAARYRAPLGDVTAWLRSEVDETEIERWLMRFSLFSWDVASVNTLQQKLGSDGHGEPADGAIAIFGLLKPLFDRHLLARLESGKPAKVGPLPRLAAMLERGDVKTAVTVARNAYHAAGIPLADLTAIFTIANPRRLTAALLIPVRTDVLFLLRQWQLPTKTKTT